MHDLGGVTELAQVANHNRINLGRETRNRGVKGVLDPKGNVRQSPVHPPPVKGQYGPTLPLAIDTAAPSLDTVFFTRVITENITHGRGEVREPWRCHRTPRGRSSYSGS